METYYIFSGAETPINFNALAIVVRVAVINARRASDNSRLSSIQHFFRIVKRVECRCQVREYTLQFGEVHVFPLHPQQLVGSPQFFSIDQFHVPLLIMQHLLWKQLYLSSSD